MSQDDFYKVKLTTLNEGMGPVDVNSTLEVEVDALTYVLNYTRYFIAEPVTVDASLPDLHPIQAAQHIALTSAYYTIIKSTYDESIWTYDHWTTGSEDLNAEIIERVIKNEKNYFTINKGRYNADRMNLLFSDEIKKYVPKHGSGEIFTELISPMLKASTDASGSARKKIMGLT
jgi:hypothetical protein